MSRVDLDALSSPERWPSLAAALLAYARPRRWFRAKGRDPRGARLRDVIPLDDANLLALLEIDFAAGGTELYAIPLASLEAAALRRLSDGGAGPALDVIAQDQGHDQEQQPDGAAGAPRVLVDGLLVPGQAADALLNLLRTGRRLVGRMGGALVPQRLPALSALDAVALPAAKIPRVEQTNSIATFGDRVLLKVYRQLTAGPNPELEVGEFLTSRCDPPCTARVLGALTYQAADGTTSSLALAHEYLANQGDAFSFMLDKLRGYFDRVSARPAPESATDAGLSLFEPLAARLGQRTGELHRALAAAPPEQPDFAPEPLSAGDRAALAARAEAMLSDQLDALSAALPRLSPAARALAERLLAAPARQAISRRLNDFRDRPLAVVKTRTHGDLHLGQVLVRGGDDFVIIDFEGEPARPLAERRAKGSPLRDVMGMVRSFGYAPEVLLRDPSFMKAGARDGERLQPWADLWKKRVTAVYLRAYLDTVGAAPFLPANPDDRTVMTTFYELEKVIYEIRYELNNRPDWVEIPLRGLGALLS